MQYSRRLIAVIAILALVLTGLMVAAQTVNAQSSGIEAVADAHIKVNGSSVGGEASLALRGAGSQEHWSIFKFTGVTAGTASVRVRVTTVRTGTLSLFTAGNNWAESPSFTWANKPAIGSTALSTKPQPAVPGDVTFDNIPVSSGDVSFWLKASYDKALTFIAAREHTTLAGPTLIQAGAPTTTTTPPTTAPPTTAPPTTAPPTTAPPTTAPPTTAPPTTQPPNQSCLLSTDYASVQAAVDDTGGTDGDPMCVTINELEQVSSPVVAKTGVTLQCLSQANGLTSPANSAWVLLTIGSVTDFSFQGCRLTSSGPTLAAAGGIDFNGTQSRIRLVNLWIENVEFGIAGAPTHNATGWTDTTFGLRVLGSTIKMTWGTGIGLYPTYPTPTNFTRYVELNGNTIIGNQRSGQAGQAGIQTGGIPPGSTHNLHSQWRILNNIVDNSPAAVGTPTGCGPGDLVDIGLDQADNFLVENNEVRHCHGNGEGIVLVGRESIIRNNRAHNVGAGAFTLISYSSAPQQIKNVTFEDNLADGQWDIGGAHGGQGLAISFGANGLPLDNLIIRRFTAINHDHGILSYPYEGFQAGTVRIEDSNLPPSSTNPWCGGLGPLDATVVNTPNCPA